jgi:hypothetical protein
MYKCNCIHLCPCGAAARHFTRVTILPGNTKKRAAAPPVAEARATNHHQEIQTFKRLVIFLGRGGCYFPAINDDLKVIKGDLHQVSPFSTRLFEKNNPIQCPG